MKTIIIALAALVIIGGGYYWYTQNKMAGTTGADTASETGTEETADDVNNGSAAQGKLDINAVCEGALAYMTFPDGDSAAQFVAECKEGEHPEVIERYKADMNLGAGAEI